MTSDLNKSITSISYNHLNLPTEISWTGSSNKIRYVYNAAGQKVKKTVVDGTTTKIVDYLDGFQTEARGSRIPVGAIATQLSNNEQYAGEVLQFFPHPEGYVKATPGAASINSPPTSYSYNYVYNYTDHLGNVRLSYSKNPATNQLNILEENHYYPFGLKHEVYISGGKRDYRAIPDDNDPRLIGVTQTDYQYKYQGQERQDELGLNWDSFKWRNYDYAIGRFMSIDPLADKYSYNSPYAFQENKLGMGIELEGLEMVSNLGRQYHWGPINAPSASSTTSNSKSSFGMSDRNKSMGRKIIDAFINDSSPSFIETASYSITTTSYSYSKDGVGDVNSISEANHLDVTTTTKTFTATQEGGFGVEGNEMKSTLKVETTSTIYAIEEGKVLGVADLGGTHNTFSTTQTFDVAPQELPEQLQSNIEQYKQDNSDILIGTLRAIDIQDDFQRLEWERNMENSTF
jgi:RHS repeat-associated protein